MTQVSLHVSRISDSSQFMPPSVQQSFYSFVQLNRSDDSCPSFVASRPTSACVYGRRLTEAEVVIKEKDEFKYPLPVFYPKKPHRESKPKHDRIERKHVQSAVKKTPSKPKSVTQSKPRAKTPSVASQPLQPLKRLIPKKVKDEVVLEKPRVPRLQKEVKPVSSVSSKSVDRISASEMMRYLEDVPQILEKQESVPQSVELQREEISEIVKESLRKQREERERKHREESQHKEDKRKRREELALHNKMIREENKTRFRRERQNPNLPWGADQRRILGLAEQHIAAEAQKLRENRRKERAKSSGRSRLGLEILDILGPAPVKMEQPQRSISAEENNSRNYSHFDSRELQIFMLKQQIAKREEQEFDYLRKQAEEDKRLSQLGELERLQRERLSHFKRAKKKKESHPKPKPKKKSKKQKRENPSEVVLPEDSEVSHIMDRVQESSSNLMEREGRSCLLFGNVEEKHLSEELGNATKLVSSIVDKYGTEEKPVLPKALATAPVADVIDSYEDSSKPMSHRDEELRAQISSLPSLEYEDHISESSEQEPPHHEEFESFEEGDREELLRRKDEVRRRLAELRNRMDDIKDNMTEDSATRDRMPEPLTGVSVVKSYELKRIVQEEAAIKIQSHIRRFLAQRRLEEMLRSAEASGKYLEENQEVAEILNVSEQKERPVEPRPRPQLSLDLHLYEEDQGSEHDEEHQSFEALDSVHSGTHLTVGEFEDRLRIEQANLKRATEQEVEVLREQNRKLLEEQKKQMSELSEEGYVQMLNTAKEQEMQQFQELMQTKCGSRVDLVEEMSMAFESMLEARYRQLVLLFSQNRERIQAALRSAPSDLDISSTLAHSTLQKQEDSKPVEEVKASEPIPHEDTGLDAFLSKVLGTQETAEIERMAVKKVEEINKQAVQQAAEEEDQPFDPYSARPENPFPAEDSESDSSLHSYQEEPYGLRSPDLSAIQMAADRTEEEESLSPIKRLKSRPSDPFTNPLQLQLVTTEVQDVSSRSLSRSGKQRYFKEEEEEKELPHVASPDPASVMKPSPMATPFRMQQSDARETEEPAKPSVPFLVSAHLLDDINSSGSFQEDLDESSSQDDSYVAIPDSSGRNPSPEPQDFTKPPKLEEQDKTKLFESVFQTLLKQLVSESVALTGLQTAPKRLEPEPIIVPAPTITVSPPTQPEAKMTEIRLPIKEVKTAETQIESPPAAPRAIIIPGLQIAEIPAFRHAVKVPEKQQVEVEPAKAPSPLKPSDRLVEEITEDLLRLLVIEAVPRSTERSVPDLPPLNFKQLEESERKKRSHESHSELPEKANASQIQEYLTSVFTHSSNEQFVLSLSSPISFDAVEILGQLQEIEQGPLITYDIQSKAIIPAEVYLLLDEGKDQESSRMDMTPSTKDIIRDSKRFHNRLIFDAVNEALQKHRPYGLKGAPLPWSKNIRTVAPALPPLDCIQAKVSAEVMEWSTYEVGKIPDGDLVLSSGQVDEEHLQMVREEKLSKMLTQEILDNDNMWVDYEAEEAQVKIDVADMILEQIMVEIEDFLQGLEGN